jgi:hypothetical protein
MEENVCGLVRFQVLTAVSMKMTAFWDIAPSSLVEADRRFRGASVNFYETTMRNFPEGFQVEGLSNTTRT